jgi:polyhydroxybutyrate depolymerase
MSCLSPSRRTPILSTATVIVALILPWAACFRDPEVGRMKCTTECPAGFACVNPDPRGPNGRCHPVGDGGTDSPGLAGSDSATPGRNDAVSLEGARLDAFGLDGSTIEVGLRGSFDTSPVDGSIDQPLDSVTAGNDVLEVGGQGGIAGSGGGSGNGGVGGATGLGGLTGNRDAASGGTSGSGGNTSTVDASISSGGTPDSGGATTGGAPGTGGRGTGGSGTGGSGTGGTGTGGSATGGSGTDGNGTGGSGTGGSGTGGNVGSGGSGGSGGTVTCPSPALLSGDSTKTITVGGLSRQYILHVPSPYTGSAPVPLVVDFHPIGGSDTQWRSGSPYPAVIDSEGVISAFPNGEPSPNLGNAWDIGGCCTSLIDGGAVDDVAFAKALVADVETVACIDTKRVYAVGFSLGGGMSNYLGCHASDVFAAVGPASWDLTQQNEAGCTPARPITVINWRGKNDNVVPYAGGHSTLVSGMAIDFLGAVGTFQKWASVDGCTGSPSAADANGCQTYSQCSAGVQVTLCTDSNGGHEAANVSVVWPMLRTYTLP